MKLFLKGNDYKYAAEQVMLVMFPSERPEYPEKYTGEDDSAYISVSEGSIFTTAYVKIIYGGKTETGICRINNANLTGKLERDRLLQRIIKKAFYKAAVKINGTKPAWGALTGIRPGKIATGLIESGLSDKETARRLQNDFFVTKERAELCINTANAGIKTKNSLSEQDIAIYVGIPFCPTRCAYCSFVSQSVEKSANLMEPFLDALYKEIEETARIIDETGLNIAAVYFGGGTPTTLSETQLDGLMNKLYGEFDLENVREFTVEAGRPDTITEGKLRVLKKHGVTRVSINPQTMSDEVLEIIGRRHSAADIISAYDLARKVGIEAVNMDLIAGLPGDSVEGFSETIDKVLALEPENVTVHTLSLKKGARIMTENIGVPDGECVGKMLDICTDRLKNAGYSPYYLYRQKFISGGFENVGWAKPGFDSLYNILIMEELCSIIALGGGASTKLVCPETGRIERIFNPKYPKEYIEKIDTTVEKKKYIRTFYEETATAVEVR